MKESEPISPRKNGFVNDHFSPMLLAGIMGRSLPHQPINFMLQKISDHLCAAHPGVIGRLAPLCGKVFLIQPLDLPYKIKLTFGEAYIKARVDDGNTSPADVHISGNLKSLIALFNGEEDGDALFFSRKISVQGDTAALLTLRNALDSDEIDLMDDLKNCLGIMKHPVSSAVAVTGSLSTRLNEDMMLINNALVKPLLLRMSAMESDIDLFRDKIAVLEKENRKIKQNIQSFRKKVV